MVAITSTPVQAIPVDKIRESTLNPRRHFRDIEALARSLVRQQFEAVVVRPHPAELGCYELANGARRFRAARLAKMETLDAKIMELTDGEMLDIILGTGAEANVDSLTPLEEADGYADAMKLLDLTLEQCAERFGREVAHVHRRLALLDLPKIARNAVERGDLSPTTAWLIARIPGKKIREETAQAIIHSELYSGVMPFRAAEIYINKHVCRTLQGAPFPTDDADLVTTAGSCIKCPYRAGNDKTTYGDVKNPHTCMHPVCFEDKIAAARARVVARAIDAGKEALPSEVNAVVFPENGKGISWQSDFVVNSHPVERDLLKTEVTTAPTWKSLCENRGVRIYVGFDQDGRGVDLVKRSEAIVAVPEKEATIFTDAVRRRYLIRTPNLNEPEPQRASTRKSKSCSENSPPAPGTERPAFRPDDPTTTLIGLLRCEPNEMDACFELRVAETRASFLLAAADNAAAAEADGWKGFCEYDFSGDLSVVGRIVIDRAQLSRAILVHECVHAAMEFVDHRVMRRAAVEAMESEAQQAYYAEAVPIVAEQLFAAADALLWASDTQCRGASPMISPNTNALPRPAKQDVGSGA